MKNKRLLTNAELEERLLGLPHMARALREGASAGIASDKIVEWIFADCMGKKNKWINKHVTSEIDDMVADLQVFIDGGIQQSTFNDFWAKLFSKLKTNIAAAYVMGAMAGAEGILNTPKRRGPKTNTPKGQR